MLETFSGDIVQSVQALKESGLPADDELEAQLQTLAQSLVNCKLYCVNHQPVPLTYPLMRALRQVHDAYSFLFPSAASLNETETIGSRIEIDLASCPQVEKIRIGELQLPRLFNGLWQLSSPAWGSASAESQDAALKDLVEAGLTTTDMADHYVSPP